MNFSLIPLQPAQKIPCISEWPKKATRDQAQIDAWKQQFQTQNFGVVADEEYCILESDDLAALKERLMLPIPTTFTVQARENRPHFYFRQTAASRAAGNMDLPGIYEFKQNRKYVCAEGSIHPTGVPYQCVNNADIVPIPDWLIGELVRLRDSDVRSTSRNGRFDPSVEVGEGGRQQALCSFAGSVWNGTQSEDEMFDLINHYNQTKCVPPKPEYKVLGVVEWIMRQKPCDRGPRVFIGKPKTGRELFHSVEDVLNAPPLKFAIEGWLQEDAITMYGGLPGHGKTLLGMSTVRALLTGNPLFGYAPFKVNRAKRVLYLCPEIGLGPLVHRLKLFGLLPFIQSDELLVRSLSSPDAPLTDPRIMEMAVGADVFLDTAVRFMEGEENSSSEQRVFAKNLFALLQGGARSVVGLHHSPKFAKTADHMSLENALRGTNELGAMLSTAWGTKLVDKDTTRLYVQNLKPRDFEPVDAFVLEGRPHIDKTGDFKMVEQPGAQLSDYQHAGRPTAITPDLGKYILEQRAKGVTIEDIATDVKVSESTIKRFLSRSKG